MRRSASVLVCVLFFLSVFSLPCVCAEQESDTLWLVALGDSITTGYEMPGGRYGCDNYVNLIAAAFEKTSDEYRNHAVNGYTVTDLLELIPNYREDISKAEIIVFDIGYNDILNPIFAYMADAVESTGRRVLKVRDLEDGWNSMTDEQRMKAEKALMNALDGPYFSGLLEEFSRGVDEVLALLREYAPDARIYMQTIYNPLAALNAMNSFSDAVIKKLNGILVAAAEENKCGCYDVFSAFDGKESEYTYMANYDIHPNETGHAVMHELFMEALAKDGVKPGGGGLRSIFFPETDVSLDVPLAVWLLPLVLVVVSVPLYIMTKRK